MVLSAARPPLWLAAVLVAAFAVFHGHAHGTELPHAVSPLAYSLGFIFLYTVSLLASGLTIFMVRTGPRRGHARGEGRRPPPEIRTPEEENPDLDIGDLK